MMRVITLCGSTKFKRQFEQVNAYLTLKGNIVISLAFFEQSEGIESASPLRGIFYYTKSFYSIKIQRKPINKDAKEGYHEYALEPMP